MENINNDDILLELENTNKAKDDYVSMDSLMKEEQQKDINVNLVDSTFIDGSFVIPRIRISKQKDYVPWGDAMGLSASVNNYPTKLISLYNNSSIHKNIINIKKHQIFGQGFSYDEKHPNAAATKEFLSNINADGEDVNELLNYSVNDKAIFNGLALLVTFSRDWQKIAQVKTIEFNNIRCAVPDELGNTNGYYYAYDWNAYRPHKIYIPKFNPNQAQLKAKEYKKAVEDFMNNNKNVDKKLLAGLDNTQIIYYKEFSNDAYFYPICSYSGAITAIESSTYADQYALNSLKNGISPLLHMHIPYQTDPEGKRRIFKDVNASYQGAKNASKVFMTFGKSGNEDDKPTLTPIPAPDVDKRYESINRNSIQSILSGHGVTHPLLIGIQTSGKLGASTELPIAQQLFYNQQIQPEQHIICKIFNKIMTYNGLAPLSIQPNNALTPEESKNNNNADGQESGNNSEIKK